MEALGVLDGEVVKAETPLNLCQLALVGLEQTQPDEPAALHADLRGAFELHRTLVLAQPIAVMGTIDDHGLLLVAVGVTAPSILP